MKEEKPIMIIGTPVCKKEECSFPSSTAQILQQCAYVNYDYGDTLNFLDLNNPQLNVPVDPGDIRNDFIERKMGKSNKRR